MISNAQQRAVSLSNADWRELDTALPLPLASEELV